jgi:SAM-dependent methyltransferase
MAWPQWRCPLHGSPLEDRGQALACPHGDSFELVDEIPRFVEGAAYAGGFGQQWRRHRLTQLDSHTGLPLSRARLQRCLGEELWASLEDRQVLECGCGAGRFTEILLERGACVTSIDLSDAVEAHRDNFPPGERHRVAQADILRPPFEPRQFDLVLCLGVVQHTPRPSETIAKLYEQVMPSGTLVLDHYTPRLGWFLSVKPLFRLYLRRLPPERSMRYTERLVDALRPVHRRAGRFGNRVLNRLSPIISFDSLIPELPETTQREWALLDTHDALTAWYMRFRTPSQIERTMHRLGIEDVHCRPIPGGVVEARGRRPAEWTG